MGNKRLQDKMEKIRSVKRCPQETTSLTRSIISSSTDLYPGISEEGRPSAGVSSATTGPSPGIVYYPVVFPP